MFAQTPTPATAAQCPIELKNFNPAKPPDAHLFVEFRNVTAKEIVGAKFKVYYVDATLDEHDPFVTQTWGGHLKPGDKKDVHWSPDRLFRSRAYKHAKIVPLRLMYADETTWTDDGSCPALWDNSYLKHHK